MGPLTILHGMALATAVAPLPASTAAIASVEASISTYNLPPVRNGARLATAAQSIDSSIPKLLPAVPIDDALQIPKFTLRDGGVMEIGAGGLKIGWHF